MDTNHEVEVVIHVDETLSAEQRADLVGKLQLHDGVKQARFSPGRDHLMVISYDAGRLRASDVLDYVKHEQTNAELIGI